MAGLQKFIVVNNDQADWDEIVWNKERQIGALN